MYKLNIIYLLIFLCSINVQLLLLERVETLREEAQDVLDVLENTDNKIQL